MRKWRSGNSRLAARRRLLAPLALEPRCLLAADFGLDHFEVNGHEGHALTILGELKSSGSSGASSGASGAPYDLSQTFFLHSLAGARHTIYLDFDGHVTSNTIWNWAYNNDQDIVTPAYDFDGNVSSFSDAELERIQRIWQRVAEDFIPFEVNVTTEDPGVDALSNTGDDIAWGVRVVIGGSSSDWWGPGVGGLGFVGSFNWSDDTPVFVFEEQLGNGDEKFVAETANHEAGHALGLNHDGQGSSEYYTGHGSGATGWAPIMGTAFYKELTQWSKGGYSGATNTEDDLAIITRDNGFGYRADDHGGSNATASHLDASSGTVWATGIIEKNTDVDVFSFSTSGGAIDISVTPFERGPNLDVLVGLYDSAMNLLAWSNPVDQLAARLTASLTAGQFFLHIDGVGKGDPLGTGYTDYGSLGRYTISGTVPQQQGDYLSISRRDGVLAEGSSGSTLFTFEVVRTGNTSGTTSVDYNVFGSGLNPADAADFAGGVAPSGTLIFGSGETSKTITVAVNGDTLAEADEEFTVSLSNASGQTVLLNDAATGVVLNDDFARVIVTPISRILRTSESGRSARFFVVLDTQPTADVVIDVRSLDTTEGVVDRSQLVFTAQNWNQRQAVRVTGVDDSIRDGHVSYTVEVGPARSDDLRYAGVDGSDVALVNHDNERRVRAKRSPRGQAAVGGYTGGALDDFGVGEDEIARFVVAPPVSGERDGPAHTAATAAHRSPETPAPRSDDGLHQAPPRADRVRFGHHRAALAQTAHHEPWSSELDALLSDLADRPEEMSSL